MKLFSSSSVLAAGLLLSQLASAVPYWTFSDATLQISQKGAEAGPKQPYDESSYSEPPPPCPTPQLYKMKPLVDCYEFSDDSPCSFTPAAPIADTLTLKTTDTLKILLTAKEGGKAQRPHQLFLFVKDSESDLESFFSFDVKDSGKARLDLVSQLVFVTVFSLPNIL